MNKNYVYEKAEREIQVFSEINISFVGNVKFNVEHILNTGVLTLYLLELLLWLTDWSIDLS